MINYRECNTKRCIADGITRLIGGYGAINFVFRSENGPMDGLLTNGAHVSDLRYHFFSLPTLIKNGHAFRGRPTWVTLDSSRSARSYFR